MIDDVTVNVARDDSNSDNRGPDNWFLTNADSRSGDYSWYCGDTDNDNDFKDGIDNSLYSRPIDLTNARDITLEAYFKFNFEYKAGRPPDGFRVEISDDNGERWLPFTLGVRGGWNLSGNESDASDGLMDGKSYTGLNSGDNWVEANTLTRLNTNLDGFRGRVILLRFRIVTNNDGKHYQDGTEDKGFYLDDVIISGTSLEGGTRGSASPRGEPILRATIQPVRRAQVSPSAGPRVESPMFRHVATSQGMFSLDSAITRANSRIQEERVLDRESLTLRVLGCDGVKRIQIRDTELDKQSQGEKDMSEFVTCSLATKREATSSSQD